MKITVESDSEGEEEEEEEEVVVEVEQQPSSLDHQDRITGRQFERMQVSHIRAKLELQYLVFSSMAKFGTKSVSAVAIQSFPCVCVCSCARPADGAKGVSPEAGRGAQSQTESGVSTHRGHDTLYLT